MSSSLLRQALGCVDVNTLADRSPQPRASSSTVKVASSSSVKTDKKKRSTISQAVSIPATVQEDVAVSAADKRVRPALCMSSPRGGGQMPSTVAHASLRLHPRPAGDFGKARKEIRGFNPGRAHEASYFWSVYVFLFDATSLSECGVRQLTLFRHPSYLARELLPALGEYGWAIRDSLEVDDAPADVGAGEHASDPGLFDVPPRRS